LFARIDMLDDTSVVSLSAFAHGTAFEGMLFLNVNHSRILPSLASKWWLALDRDRDRDGGKYRLRKELQQQ
jgi:hypothetical protein